MAAPRLNKSFDASTNHDSLGTTCFFDQINTPGCYVVNQTGTLIRVPSDGIAPGRSPVIELVSNEKWTVTQLSADPFLTRTKARLLAADYDLDVNF